MPRATSVGSGRALSLAGLAAATMVAFGPALNNGWVLIDDPEYVLENPLVNHGWSWASARALLTAPHGHNWHPLTSWSHLLDVQLFGLDPAGPHAINLLLHVAVVVTLVLALYRMTGAWWRSLLVGAFFAIHPLRAESVAWVSERKDVLSGLCFALTLVAYARWVERKGPWRHATLLGFAALGLVSKPMLVTLPFVLLLLDAWPLRRWSPGGLRARVLEKWPLFLMAAVSAVVTFVVQRREGAMRMTTLVPLPQRAANAVLSLARYVLELFWPARLAAFYPYDRSLPVVALVLAIVAIAAVSVAVVAQGRKRPWLAVGWLWYVGMLVPVLGIVQVGGQAHADRYTYLPGIGLLVIAVWGAAELVARWRVPTAVLGAACAALLLALGVATARQVETWRDSRTLFSHAIAVTRDNAFAEQGLGNALMREGDVAGAYAHLSAAERIDATMPDLQNTLGSAAGMLGRFDESEAHFRAALTRHETAEVHHNLGLLYEARGRPDLARPQFEAALRLDPNDTEAARRLQSPR